MKNLSKSVFLSVAVASVLVASAVAEESAGFIGLELGASGGLQEAKITGTATNQSRTASDNLETYGVNAGIVGGYKAFFTSWFGLRAYANLNFIHTLNEEMIREADGSNLSTDQAISALNYGVNLDLLFNVLAFQQANLGLFVGAGLGANTFFASNAIDAAKKKIGANPNFDLLPEALQGQLNNDIKDNKAYTGFDAWVNVGVRTNFLEHHGIEVVAKVPFVGTTVYDKTIGAAGVSANANVKLYNPWNVSVRYIYSF
ncbi:outer membrane beta-barrel protein [Helicobacter macacae]|uniref:Outer membrane protein beta-barrel domain-containing protein n=1 Tax=Helicobacter macacae MIT 99-5501 TaxID=1357400 RepID=V8CDH4_9HELI|nr:outer membrane beta-barrel protein [Helicobacter macacae]ETD24786.1 hypothetical protein HMPREF2086_00120 [Helicobacter macacae MIT 99-5501]